MSHAFCTALNLISQKLGQAHALHPQVIMDVHTLYGLQAVWHEEELMLTEIPDSRKAQERWGIETLSDQDLVKLSWKEDSFMVYAQQSFDCRNEIVAVRKDVGFKQAYVFTFLFSATGGWKGRLFEMYGSDELESNCRHLDDHKDAILDAFEILPESLQNSLPDDIREWIDKQYE